MRTANPTTIVELWRSGRAPAWDGLYRADGSARSAQVDGDELSWFELGEPLDLDALLAASPDHVTEVGVPPDRVTALRDGSGYVGCGEGALGADGFFARFDEDHDVVWLVFLSDSNPFERVSVDGSLATFTNNLGNTLTVDLDDPDFAP
ncbi:hypothetical protein ACFV2H_40475 [Streptomyces sp. NPDC059629]|uniref:hypothetical protein n=1 Tax=Streptomyces sp. NPDC059629 TaxID=3346889 RepID=UPI003677B120